jgi:hypothetical protein
LAYGIDDFSVGERVLFIKQQITDDDGNLIPAYGDGVIAKINREDDTIELDVRTLVHGWFDRVTKRPAELQKLPKR